MAVSEQLRPKALAALREGRVKVIRARTPADAPSSPQHEVVAVVQSSHNERVRHVVDFLDGLWTCVTGTVECEQPCAPVAAVQLVTGHESVAAKAAS